MTRVKVCGITNLEDAQAAVEAGAWALGFVFYKESPRCVSPSVVRKIVEMLPPFVTPVGVFVNQNAGAVRDICRFTRIQTVQFHGDEKHSYCKKFSHCKIIKAFRVNQDFDIRQVNPYKVDAYLFDTHQDNAYGGTGKTFNWNIIKDYQSQIKKPFILSGGLTSDNVRGAIEALNPYAVDVSSSVEQSPGIKDRRKMNLFMDMVKFPKTSA